jgi:hypothetical protein
MISLMFVLPPYALDGIHDTYDDSRIINHYLK